MKDRLILMAVLTLMLLLLLSPAQASLEPPAHPLFDGDAVHEIRLTFDQPNWWTLLEDNFENYPDDPPYLPGSFEWGVVQFDSIGVRFKGNSSYGSYPGVKKSFKLDIDEYVLDQTVYGLDKLNLNNGFMDPSFVREKSCYELCEAAGLPTERTNFAALYINNTYWGLYTLVEQFDQEFIESRFGPGEEGNLWKGEPHGSLEYLGTNESSYYADYELKTNEEENDWSSLVELTDKLNNTSLASLPDTLSEIMEVSSALAMLAIDNLTVNLDSYIGRCVNYYLYHRDLDSRFVFSKWDVNESWGIFNMWNLSQTQLRQLDPLWVNPQPGQNRPLAERLWDIPQYEEIYLGHFKRLMAGAADPDRLVARMEAMRDLIRPFVYLDNNKMFTNTEFDNAMTSNIYDGPRIIPALETFIRARDSWLRGRIGTWTPADGLVLNEVMSDNNQTLADDYGDFDDWIEIVNNGAGPVNLFGYYLTDDMAYPQLYAFPDTTIQPGEYFILWADGETSEGSLHTSFKLSAGGEDLFFLDGSVIRDALTIPALGAEQPYGRWPDATGDWQLLSLATPGAENQNPTEPEEITLFINEFIALNNSGIQDSSGSYEDWLEIYNPGPDPLALGGLYLTDDLANPTQWALPDTSIAGEGFLLFWCDNDEEEGPLHTNFKLSGDGEDLGLFGRLTAGNEAIDTYTFGAQSADISEGRSTDGGSPWIFFSIPTPGASNGAGTGVVTPDTVWRLTLSPCQPDPFKSSTLFRFTIPRDEEARLEIFNVQGRRVASLIDGRMTAGQKTFEWSGRDNHGDKIASGVYFARLTLGLESKTQRLVRLR
ncbi:MAG: CotH kinase family protein [Candidatus Eisenbacteria bacterium]|uniref:CotH kinase family protein n=1 Tax=Eiseniibacteriota bacterium TaxID=2212470 RepID=A0A948S048_UNCEI|nr:CotH kinase family protein [Candidatus Eisenbacteria bacterium]MBU1949934.1 CotH kinase family protein [Candidatus Eisenbacteria bacterium]MBU2692774.1 CotH kinase family protein [Candidatus Eisenbacteria bacterium]